MHPHLPSRCQAASDQGESTLIACRGMESMPPLCRREWPAHSTRDTSNDCTKARHADSLCPTLENLRELLEVGCSRPRREVVVDAQQLEGSLWGPKHLLLRQSGHHCRPAGKGSNLGRVDNEVIEVVDHWSDVVCVPWRGRTLQRTSPRALFSHAPSTTVACELELELEVDVNLCLLRCGWTPKSPPTQHHKKPCCKYMLRVVSHLVAEAAGGITATQLYESPAFEACDRMPNSPPKQASSAQHHK